MELLALIIFWVCLGFLICNVVLFLFTPPGLICVAVGVVVWYFINYNKKENTTEDGE